MSSLLEKKQAYFDLDCWVKFRRNLYSVLSGYEEIVISLGGQSSRAAWRGVILLHVLRTRLEKARSNLF